MQRPPRLCSAFIATSLDGFIAREDGSIDWLLDANNAVPTGEDCGYAAFMARTDALVMGRKTLETVLAFSAWPYGTTPIYCLSRHWQQLPAGTPASVSLHKLEPEALVALAAGHGHHRLYVDGGETIRRLLDAGCLDELIITRIPVLIGKGRPLFGPIAHDHRLELLSSRYWPFGFVQDHYRVLR